MATKTTKVSGEVNPKDLSIGGDFTKKYIGKTLRTPNRKAKSNTRIGRKAVKKNIGKTLRTPGRKVK